MAETEPLQHLAGTEGALVATACTFLAEHLEIEASLVTPDVLLVEELNVDSIVLLTLLEHLERTHELRLDIRAMAREAGQRDIGTLREVCRLVADWHENRLTQ